MPNLHVHYYHGNVKAFRQELDGTATTANGGGGGSGGPGGGGSFKPGSSGGKSWSMSGLSQPPVKGDPNERDHLGRTVLHLTASSRTQQAYNFFSILLRNPNISVNLQDHESGYTALHRALFVGNLRAARDLLLRGDIDPSIKDWEGMTAYDLYNGTVDGTNPTHELEGTDLYTWGVNRNLTLGTGDSSDKAFPDRVNLLTQNQVSGRPDPTQKFNHVGVKDVVMAKLHTGAVTTEPRGNLSVCGFGSNGRLGKTIHSQLAMLPMSDFPHSVTGIALGQDHTLAVTSGGYVLSWGNNRFSQLGYAFEPAEKPVGAAGLGKDEQEIQVSPKRIVGSLKKEFVIGVAAGRMSSACWTADSLFTWGTNAGHLGYDKAANPVQVQPRKVTGMTQPVIDVAITDYAMVCLLDTFEVVCFHHDTSFKISFSTPKMMAEVPFRPPQSTLRPMIKKVTSCGSGFAALSSIGDVFTFSLPNPLEDISKDARDRHVNVKPQLIWALRKGFTAVKDVALGLDGTVIICTGSGHVFVRSRVKAGAGQLKFRRIPYLQRVIKVACNESGAFAAVRVDARPKPIPLTGKTLAEDLFGLQPHFRRLGSQMNAEDWARAHAAKAKAQEEDEDESYTSVSKDIAVALQLCAIISRWKATSEDSLFSWSDPLAGSDLTIVVKDTAIPAHSVIIAARAPALARLLKSNDKVERFSRGKADPSRITVQACHPMVVLLLLQYIYSDEVASIWDIRVTRAMQEKYPDLKLPFAQIKADLKALSDILDLSPLSRVLDATAKQPIATATLARDVEAFFAETHGASGVAAAAAGCDVALVLADRTVHCWSAILRARCPFFEAMFADPDWTAERDQDGVVKIKMEHLKWKPMNMVFKYIHACAEDNLFDYMHQETLDDFLDFVFEVLAAATELLLDRLVLVCSRTVIKHCNAYNAAALACEANFYQATHLKLSIFDYIIASMETMLESGLLDDMDDETLAELSKTIEQKQNKKLWVSRSQALVQTAMVKHKDWLSQQDIPVPRVRQPWRWKPREAPLAAAPTASSKGKGKASVAARPPPLAQSSSPRVGVSTGDTTADGIFQMDDDISSPPATVTLSTPARSRPVTPLDLSASRSGPVWKSAAVEAAKVDLRSIMAETQSSTTPTRPPAAPRTATSISGRPVPGSGSPLLTPSRPPVSVARQPSATASGSGSTPWRAVEPPRTGSFAAVQSQQASTPPKTATSARSFSQQIPAAPAAASPRPAPNTKVITPVKLPTGTALPRRTSGPVWSASAATPFAPPPSYTSPAGPGPSTSPSQAFSLLAIQQEERDYADRQVKKPVKSLADIQREEREAQTARDQEDEFMRWWQEEEARLARESGANGANGSNAGGTSGGAGRGRGRGRGGPRRATGRGRGGSRGGGGGGGGGGSGGGQLPASQGHGEGQGQQPKPKTPKKTPQKGGLGRIDD